MLPKLIILGLLLTIIISLGSSLVFMMRDKNSSTRSVKALSWRVGLSMLAFALLMLGAATGYLKPHGLLPTKPQTSDQQGNH